MKLDAHDHCKWCWKMTPRECTEWSWVSLSGHPAEAGENGEEGESEMVMDLAGALGQDQCWPLAIEEEKEFWRLFENPAPSVLPFLGLQALWKKYSDYSFCWETCWDEATVSGWWNWGLLDSLLVLALCHLWYFLLMMYEGGLPLFLFWLNAREGLGHWVLVCKGSRIPYITMVDPLNTYILWATNICPPVCFLGYVPHMGAPLSGWDELMSLPSGIKNFSFSYPEVI